MLEIRLKFYDNTSVINTVDILWLISFRNTIDLLGWFLAHTEFGDLSVWDLDLNHLRQQTSIFF